MKLIYYFEIILLLFFTGLIFPENSKKNDENQKIVKETKTDINGYGKYLLGDNIKDIINKISNDNNLTISDEYNYYKQDIVSERNEYFIKAVPNNYYDNFYFQFFNKKLYLIRIVFSKRFFSFNKIYKSLKKKYGNPGYISYKKVIWKKNKKTLILERDTVVKYIDLSIVTNKAVTNSIINSYKQKKIDTILSNL